MSNFLRGLPSSSKLHRPHIRRMNREAGIASHLLRRAMGKEANPELEMAQAIERSRQKARADRQQVEGLIKSAVNRALRFMGFGRRG